MVFSSTVFLFQLLPVCLAVYFGVLWATRKQQYANVVLIFLSLAFYFVANGYLVLLLVLSIGMNHVLGRTIALAEGRSQRAYLTLGVAANVGLLAYFKYGSFMVQSVVDAGRLVGLNVPFHAIAVALPVGISFYTFMSISYLVDVYRTRTPAKSIVEYGVYLSLFPHLVAGPIVRFSEIRDAIVARRVDRDMFLEGIFRFSIGMARKVIIADTLAVQADRIFALPAGELTAALAWTGAICYAFQIFYDFSGYTDMAIGLAKMLGFHFPENFAQPYTAASVTEFWRRWHMTLTRWFRDYVYIPLGGNRSGGARTYANLFAVFFLCGLWHGAAWTFVFWGIYHGALLVIERLVRNLTGFRTTGPAGVLLTFFLVTLGWVFFRSVTIVGAFQYLGTMFSIAPHGASAVHRIEDYLTPSTIFYLVVAAAFAFAPQGLWSRARVSNSWGTLAQGSLAIVVLVISIAYVSETTFRPFIYFRF